jgi:hypothetical protein
MRGSFEPWSASYDESEMSIETTQQDVTATTSDDYTGPDACVGLPPCALLRRDTFLAIIVL